MQDVLALAAEIRSLQRDLYPFVVESHRERASGRFDDALARLTELDRDLRETAHSLETTSIVSRPLGEVLHREADGFTRRTGIETQFDVRGDVDALSPSQRIVIFRAVQEALSNIREHSAATTVSVLVRTRRSTTDVSITDDGQGFEVAAASPERHSEAGWVWSGSASEYGCSAARSTSTAAPAARRRFDSRCRAGSRSTPAEASRGGRQTDAAPGRVTLDRGNGADRKPSMP